MAISTEIVGKEFGPFVQEYTFKDLGSARWKRSAGFDGKTDLIYVNEGDAANPDLKVLPIFGAPLTVHGDDAHAGLRLRLRRLAALRLRDQAAPFR